MTSLFVPVEQKIKWFVTPWIEFSFSRWRYLSKNCLFILLLGLQRNNPCNHYEPAGIFFPGNNFFVSHFLTGIS
jgi:hypothetical protein